MICGSTAYYRKNKESNKVLHSCPYCDYTTPNCKVVMMNHINANHVDEDKRPYQCELCERGFAQKAHLTGHLKKIHGVVIPVSKVSTILYNIAITNCVPKSSKTLARHRFYIANPVLKSRDIYNKKHQYLPGVYLKNHDLHYDLKKGFITIKKRELRNPVILKRRKIKVIISC